MTGRVGVVVPFDFAMDRELWRWVPGDVDLHITRTPYMPEEVTLDLARTVAEHDTLATAVRTLNAVSPDVVAYACTAGSFVGGIAGEKAMCQAMTDAGAVPSLTTSGALLEALAAADARRVALVTPYIPSVSAALESYLAEADIEVAGSVNLGLTRHIWEVSRQEIVDNVRCVLSWAKRVDAVFIACTNLSTYDVLPELELELGMPVLSANQVTVQSALARLGGGTRD